MYVCIYVLVLDQAHKNIMLNAVRSVSSRSPSLANQITQKTTGLRFVQSVSGPNQPDTSNKMEQQPDATGEAASSLGGGYATRADEEGFGGIYKGNQPLPPGDEEKIVHGNAPEYDRSQGSEVKEKERARNQSKVAS